MKKNYAIFLIIFLCLNLCGFGQTEYFNLGGGGTFPANWTGTNNVTANNIDQSSYYLVDPGNPSDIITTASYDLSAHLTATFEVKIGSFGSNNHNSLKVEVSLDGGTTFTQTYTTTATTNSTETLRTINITSVSSNVVLRLSNNGTSGRGIRMQDLILTGYGVGSTDTKLNFASTTYSADETSSTVNICVDITNENTTPTTASVVLISSHVPHITYTTAEITFPANSSVQQCVTIIVNDNISCGDTTDYTFELQNVSGGLNASAGGSNETTLNVSDNDSASGVIFIQDFDGGTPAWDYIINDEVNSNFNVRNSLTNINYANITGNFIGINDADDGNNSVELATVSTSGMTDIVFSFDYDVYEFDNGDDMFYELFYDGVSQGLVEFVTGNSNFSTEGTISVSIPNGTNTVAAKLSVYQNGGSDYGAWDNIQLTANQCLLPTPKINIQGNGTDIANGNTAISTTDDTDFGDVLISGGTNPNTFTIYNTGTADLELTNIISSNNSDFTISGTTSGIIVAGSSATFTITFNPTTTGNATSIISITSNATNQTTYTFNIEGNGTDIPNIVLNSSNPAITATNLQADDDIENTPIYAFNLSVTNYEAVLTAFNITTSGTAINNDITNFKAWYSTNATLNVNTDTFLNIISTNLGAATHTFSGFSQTISSGNTGYFFITTDLPCGATNGNTIIVNAITPLDFTFTSGNTTGVAYASGTHTINETTPNNVSALSTTNCENGSVNLTWTDATGCIDDYLVVASTSIETAPNTNSFSANTTYGNSTPYGNGYVVYQGSSTTTTVTGLTNGTQYYYTIFTRNGDSWSNGISVNCTPQTSYCTPAPWSSNDSEIEGVTLIGENNTIANASINVCTNTVQDHTDMSADLFEGGTYTLTVEFGDCGTNYIDYNGAGGVWIDWNNDGDFDDIGEKIATVTLVGTNSGTNQIEDILINVPSGQTTGNYRMRIIQDEGGSEASIDPCTSPGWGTIADYTVEIIPSCTPTHTFTSMLPTSGTEGTEVTVTGTGFTTNTTATFGGINTTVGFVNATTLIIHIPSGATTNSIRLTESGCSLTTTTFTVITASGSCTTATAFTDIIISEVYDAEDNNVWYVELYNPTALPIDLDLGDYEINRYADLTTSTVSTNVDLTGIIPAYGVFTLSLGTSPSTCNDIAFDAYFSLSGINEQDRNVLTKGGVDIDVVEFPNEKGYSILRDPNATSPLVSSIINNSDCSFLDFSITATEGDLDTTGDLTYQWYFNDGINDTWEAVTSTSPMGYTILNTNGDNLLIEADTNPLTTLNSYQFYCEVTEAGSCSEVSNTEKPEANTTTWNGISWSNNTPNINTRAIINGNYNTATHGSFSACSLLVNSGQTLTITDNTYVEIYYEVINNGVFNILNNGALVQIDDNSSNTGNISVERTTSIRKLDYVYWSSPVTGFNVNAISPNTSTNLIYKWNPTAINSNLTQGDWETATGETMTVAKGYIVRGPNSYGTTATNYTATFNNGVPHNGEYNINVYRGNNPSSDVDDDDWNLLGNPYPSSISAIDFLSDPINTATLDGFINIWTHGTLPTNTTQSPFYEVFETNYTADDYITYNASGTSSGPGTFDGYIASGQSFMVNTVDGLTSATLNARFKNSMRNKAYNNSNFYRTATVNKHRIWLDLTPQNQTSTRILTGYIDGATNDRDRLYDAITDSQNFYSILNNQAFIIQGKALPFEDTDTIPLGLKLTESGDHTISIAAVDGLFETDNQNIYIKDNLTNTTFNITNMPYTFASEAGIFNERFEIVFKPLEVLTLKDNVLSPKTLTITEHSDGTVQFSVSSTATIKNIQIIDVVGRILYQLDGDSNNEIYTLSALSNATYIAKVTLSNGQVITKKAVKRH